MMWREDRIVSLIQNLNSSRRRCSVDPFLICGGASSPTAATMRPATASLCKTSIYVLVGASIGAARLTGKSSTSLPCVGLKRIFSPGRTITSELASYTCGSAYVIATAERLAVTGTMMSNALCARRIRQSRYSSIVGFVRCLESLPHDDLVAPCYVARLSNRGNDVLLEHAERALGYCDAAFRDHERCQDRRDVLEEAGKVRDRGARHVHDVARLKQCGLRAHPSASNVVEVDADQLWIAQAASHKEHIARFRPGQKPAGHGNGLDQRRARFDRRNQWGANTAENVDLLVLDVRHEDGVVG